VPKWFGSPQRSLAYATMEVKKGTDRLLPSAASSGEARVGRVFCRGVCVFGCGCHEMMLTYE